MTRGGPGQRKGGAKECKICAHPGLAEIEAMLLNVEGGKPIPYNTIIAVMKRNHPAAPALTKPNLTTHKQQHLLTKPITRTVTTEDGEEMQQTYMTGHYEAQSLVIPQTTVPQIPSLADGLKIIIAAALHNVLNNPHLVTVKDGLEAMKLLKALGGGAGDLDALLGAWGEVADQKAALTRKAKAKVTRKVTVEREDTVELPEPQTAIEGEWSEAEIEGLALPVAGETTDAGTDNWSTE